VKTGKAILLLISHSLAVGLGFAVGVYALPILIAPDAPSMAVLSAEMDVATFTGEFRRDLEDSDALHWGEGTVAVSERAISLVGRLSPGPDYKLYLSPEFIETEAEFDLVKPRMALVGDVKTFDNFLVQVPSNVDPAQYTTVIVWCEAFGEFITAAQYQSPGR
jgi:hypothetical protein